MNWVCYGHGLSAMIFGPNWLCDFHLSIFNRFTSDPSRRHPFQPDPRPGGAPDRAGSGAQQAGPGPGRAQPALGGREAVPGGQEAARSAGAAHHLPRVAATADGSVTLHTTN